MATIIKYLKFPFRFSALRMQQEVQNLQAKWLAHYNQHDYEGSWTALPLRSINGSMENVMANAGEYAIFADTQLMQQCPYLQEIMQALQCEKMAVRLLNLQAGAVIKEHKDVELNFEQGEARIHIPIVTNNDVAFFIDDEQIMMHEGECWYANFNMKHRVTNAGNTDRIHLVMDCKVNDWLREQFDNEAVEIKKEIPAPPKYTAEQKAQIISSLRAMNTDTANRMADEMEADT
jgi:mannose-6-phosphate isomerase-like protein (cupin superfamily)